MLLTTHDDRISLRISPTLTLHLIRQCRKATRYITTREIKWDVFLVTYYYLSSDISTADVDGLSVAALLVVVVALGASS